MYMQQGTGLGWMGREYGLRAGGGDTEVGGIMEESTMMSSQSPLMSCV